MKSVSHDKMNKFEASLIRLDGNTNILGHKTNMVQERISNL